MAQWDDIAEFLKAVKAARNVPTAKEEAIVPLSMMKDPVTMGLLSLAGGMPAIEEASAEEGEAGILGGKIPGIVANSGLGSLMTKMLQLYRNSPKESRAGR